jgi:membrane dipeptidase
MFIVDAHLDLAFNALRDGRDVRLPLDELRRAEGTPEKARGTALVTLPELRHAGVGLVFGTLFAAPATYGSFKPGEPLVYTNPEEAFRVAMDQLDYYHRLADELAYIRLVTGLASLDEVVASHGDNNDQKLLGIVPLMEGADPVREPEELEQWYERGLRFIGPAWDDTRYAPGAWRDGGRLPSAGYRLLEVMAGLGFILDLTHMAERASLEALEAYPGPVVATHSNARALVPTQRQLSDEQIRALREVDGVCGVVLYNAFLLDGHRKGEARQRVPLSQVVAHIDHICQQCGDADHVGIGSDFDGGFGLEDIPDGMAGVSDLALIGRELAQQGYEPAHVEGIMGGNWLRLLRRAWKAG